MAFVTSRNFALPDTPEGLTNGLWFNMWARKLRPYNELESGDTLFWYESPTRCIVWRSNVVDAIRFPYERKKDVETKLKLTTAQAAQPYFVDAPDSGFCLSYKVEALERLSLPKPDDFRFPHQGWLHVDDELAERWSLPGYVRVLDSDASPNLDVDIHSFAATEGHRRLVLHLQRERNQTLVRKKKKHAASLNCEVCGFSFGHAYGSAACDYCEVHHLLPFSDVEHSTRTRMQDLAILCANCHRVVHLHNPPFTLDQVRNMLLSNGK